MKNLTLLNNYVYSDMISEAQQQIIDVMPRNESPLILIIAYAIVFAACFLGGWYQDKLRFKAMLIPLGVGIIVLFILSLVYMR